MGHWVRVPRTVVWLDGVMDHEADFIKETRYLAEHMRRSCEHALWRVEQLLSRLEEGESLNTSSTAAQLDNAREELRRALGGIERIEALCELESRRKEGGGEYPPPI